ncbi:MAG: metallophosphoesterase [Eubacteriaceae bacterium]|nr:metallophosphoesterase [Eubacteriaceae bacterium]
MKILIFSDSHGDTRKMKEIASNSHHVDLILHLGDNVLDAIELNNATPVKVLWVKGNTDHGDAPDELVVDAGEHKILMTHGHKYGIKAGLQRLYYKCKETGADIALFGHSHIALNEEFGEVIFLNPGSIADKRHQKYHSYGIINIDDDKIDTRIVYIK